MRMRSAARLRADREVSRRAGRSAFVRLASHVPRGPPVVPTTLRLSKLRELATEIPHIRRGQANAFGGVQAERMRRPIFHRLQIDFEALGLERALHIRACGLGGQAEKEIHVMRFERVGALRAQTLDGARGPAIVLLNAQFENENGE